MIRAGASRPVRSVAMTPAHAAAEKNTRSAAGARTGSSPFASGRLAGVYWRKVTHSTTAKWSPGWLYATRLAWYYL